MSFANRALQRRRGRLRGRSALPRLVTGVDRIEALSLPVRLALLDHVRRHGPATATEAGNAIGLSPAAASYHLRVLGQHGFIRESGDDPDGRKRRWVAQASQLMIDPTTAGSAAEAHALDRLEAALFEHASDLFAGYVERRHEFPDSWRQAASSVQDTLILTPAEVSRLRADLLKLLARYRSKRTEAKGDATSVFVAFNAVPRDPPPGARRRSAAAGTLPEATQTETIQTKEVIAP